MDTQIVGEPVAGQAKQIHKQIKALIHGMNVNTFDLVDVLHEMKSKKHYASLGYDTFSEYGKSLDLKLSKTYYLAKIGDVMSACGIPRAEYEPIGIAKLRVITKLDLFDKDGKVITHDGITMVEVVKAIADTAAVTDIEQIEAVVDKLQGKTGDNAEVWLNFKVKKIVRDNVVQPALELAKMNIGTVAKDEDGIAVEPSDSAALEGISASYLTDAANSSQLLKS